MFLYKLKKVYVYIYYKVFIVLNNINRNNFFISILINIDMKKLFILYKGIQQYELCMIKK